MYFTLFFVAVSLPIPALSVPFLPCPLNWVPHKPSNSINEGSQSFVLSFGQQHILARAKGSDGIWHVGYLSSDGVARLPTSPFVFAEVELLSNGHNCTLIWGKRKPSWDYLTVPVAKDNPLYVGRLSLSSFTGSARALFAGEVRKGVLHYVSVADAASQSGEFEILYSFTKGFHMTLKDFKFRADPTFAKYRVLQVETIENLSSAVISHSIIQSNSVTTSHYLTEFSSHTISWGIAAAMQATVNSVTFSGSTEYAQETEEAFSKTFAKSVTTVFTVYKNITVSSMQSVVACSAIKVNNDFESEYEATAVYTAPGLEGKEVAKLLKDLGFLNITESDLSASTTIKGQYRGATVLQADFFVTPKNAAVTCRNIHETVG